MGHRFSNLVDTGFLSNHLAALIGIYKFIIDFIVIQTCFKAVNVFSIILVVGRHLSSNTMDTSSEDLDESMLDVIQRAEAFISAHSFLNREAERSSNNIFDASDDSFRTATDESSSANDSGTTAHSTNRTSDEMNQNDGHGSSRNEAEDHRPAVAQNVEVLLSDDSQDTLTYEIDEPSLLNRPPVADNDDCIVIEDPHQVVVDLCSPYQQLVSPRSRRARRRRADTAPVVESISLDDTVAEPVPQTTTRQSPKKRITAASFVQPSPPAESPTSAVPSVSVTCPICLESIFHQQAASTVCGHLFCKNCITQEIQIRKKCPMCKRALKRHQVHPIYFN